MLPAFLTSPKSATKSFVLTGVTAALIATSAAAPAMAWGSKQQNFLAGVASTLLLTAIIRPDVFQGRPRAQPVYAPPQPPVYPQPGYGNSIYQTPTALAFKSYSRNERLRIQSALASGGYYRGTIDGSFGPGTYNAVTAFAANTGKSGMLSTRSGAYTLFDGLLF
jgi:hypothetical protein